MISIHLDPFLFIIHVWILYRMVKRLVKLFPAINRYCLSLNHIVSAYSFMI